MERRFIFAYTLVCYAIFLACFLYSIAFVADSPLVPKTVDSGPIGTRARAIAVDLGLLTIFAFQHSGMARSRFKRVFTRIISAPAERATYVLLSSFCLALVYTFWEPLDGHLWSVRGAAGSMLSWLYLGGWGLLLYATTLIDHFDLFGLRQGWLQLRGRSYAPHPFRTPGLYRWLRHPIYLAWFVIFWATPVMSNGHLLLAVVTTAYILVAARLEEQDLIGQFGDAYRRYMETTPRYLPMSIPSRRVE